ncbi:MAG: hypothetical protein KHW60_04945, partial [Oscillibacter sp.]|nr:hypothetical protein [Oscillibacter sp.]
HSMCSSVVKQKNSKKCCKAKTFFGSSCGTCAQGCFFPKIGPPQQGYFPGFPCMEGLEVPLLFTEGHFVSGGRSDLFSDISLLLQSA